MKEYFFCLDSISIELSFSFEVYLYIFAIVILFCFFYFILFLIETTTDSICPFVIAALIKLSYPLYQLGFTQIKEEEKTPYKYIWNLKALHTRLHTEMCAYAPEETKMYTNTVSDIWYWLKQLTLY